MNLAASPALLYSRCSVLRGPTIRVRYADFPGLRGAGSPGELILTPLELIDRLAALIPPPHTHRHRYYGILAPNATLRAAVTALAREATNGAQQQTGQEKQDTEDAVKALWRPPARYLWAMLLASPYLGGDLRAREATPT